MGRQIVLVSGPPGAGKTTLSRPLAAELGFALLAKDQIKETLHDWLWPALPEVPSAPDLDWSQRLGAASMELLWTLAADAPAVVLDANFWPDSAVHGERVRSLRASTVEVHCLCPIEVCARRYSERAGSRHSVHVDGQHLGLIDGPVAVDGSAGFADAFARSARALGLGPVITVDTTRPVDISALAADVLRHFDGADRRSTASSGECDR